MYDSFNRQINYLRISVTDRCNLRCTYCMPAEGIPLCQHQDILTFEEIEQLTRAAVQLGIDKVRLTGGEPLVRRDIVQLVAKIAAIPGINDLAMTSNAILLPQYAQPLRQAGLHRLNLSLDTLDPQRFREITRGGNLQDTLNGIHAARQAGFTNIKLNCVINQSPQEPDAQTVAQYAQKHHLPVRYIRQMNTATGQFWRVINGDGGHCQTCNRLRVSSNGQIYPCLFSDFFTSVRLLGPQQAIRAAVAAKPQSGHRSHHQFYAIGG